MRRIFGAPKDKGPVPTLEDANTRINKRGDNLEERVRKLDAELYKYREQMKRTRPGPALEALKARATRVLKQKKMLQGQRDQLYAQSYNVEQLAFASENMRDAQHTLTAMQEASAGMKTQMQKMKIEKIDALQDDMMDMLDYNREVNDALSYSYDVPEDIDEHELMGELDALEADMGAEPAGASSVPSYLLPDEEPHVAAAPQSMHAQPMANQPAGAGSFSLPSAPAGQPQAYPNVPQKTAMGVAYPNT